MAQTDNATVTTTMDASDDEESFVDVMEPEQLQEQKSLTLSLTPKNHSIGMKSDVTSALICATIKACALPEENERTPVDIVVALDLSSSMMGEKLSLCKRTIEQLLRNLLPQDRFGLVAYSDEADIAQPLQLMTTGNKHKILTTLKKISAYGNTNISAAIGLSFQELQSVATPSKVRSIFLLTDGNANRGIFDPQGLTDLTISCWNDSKNLTTDGMKLVEDADEVAKQPGNPRPSFFGSLLNTKKAAVTTDKDSTTSPVGLTIHSDQDSSPVSLVCFGYGSDHNAQMLRDLSEATETGSYYYVQSDSDVSSAFGDALGGLVSIVAQSAVLTVIPPSKDVQIQCVHHERAIRREDAATNSNGATYTVSLGDFYAEETRDVLIEVTLATTNDSDLEKEVSSLVPHLLASLSYTDILKKMPIRTLKPAVCLIKRLDDDEVSADNEHVAKQWLRVYATNEMEEAEKSAQLGHLDNAKRRLQNAIDRITAAELNSDEMVDQLSIDLKMAMNGCTSERKYNLYGSKNLAHHKQTYKRQRMSTANALTKSPYRTSYKMSLAQEFQNQTSAPSAK